MLSVGDLVFIYSDGNKLSPRPRYIVISIDGAWCTVRKMDKTLFATKTYELRLEEVYKVPGFNFKDTVNHDETDSDDDYDMVPVSWDNTPTEQPKPVVNPVQAPLPKPVIVPRPVEPVQFVDPLLTPTHIPGGKQVLPPGSPVTGPPVGRHGLRDRNLLKAPVRDKDYVP